MFKHNKITFFIAIILTSSVVFSQNTKKIVSGNNKFAMELYSNISSNNKAENILFSPFSIYQAMSVIYSGANNNTKKQIQNIFNFSDTKQYLYIEEINKLLKDSSDSVRMEIANSMLIQQDYTIKPEYIDIVKKNYNIPIEKVNFKSKQDRIEITKEVNNWVKSNTNNQIQQLLESSDLSKYTRLLLINAIYFHGEWKYEFDEKRTRKQVFKSPKAERSVNFMSKDADFLYYSDSILSSVQIPYKGDDISMTILLPKEDINIDKLDNRLNINYLDNIVSQMNKKKVFLDIPKFTIEYSINLKQTFQAMGMVDAFSKIADFSNITEKNDLKIDKILHKSKINIDEKGTKASSATSVSMIQKTAFIPSIKFKANRPFVYVIRENHTGIILFVGKVCDFEL